MYALKLYDDDETQCELLMLAAEWLNFCHNKGACTRAVRLYRDVYIYYINSPYIYRIYRVHYMLYTTTTFTTLCLCFLFQWDSHNNIYISLSLLVCERWSGKTKLYSSHSRRSRRSVGSKRIHIFIRWSRQNLQTQTHRAAVHLC